jgi:hypothetical protein
MMAAPAVLREGESWSGHYCAACTYRSEPAERHLDRMAGPLTIGDERRSIASDCPLNLYGLGWHESYANSHTHTRSIPQVTSRRLLPSEGPLGDGDSLGGIEQVYGSIPEVRRKQLEILGWVGARVPARFMTNAPMSNSKRPLFENPVSVNACFTVHVPKGFAPARRAGTNRKLVLKPTPGVNTQCPEVHTTDLLSKWQKVL